MRALLVKWPGKPPALGAITLLGADPPSYSMGGSCRYLPLFRFSSSGFPKFTRYGRQGPGEWCDWEVEPLNSPLPRYLPGRYAAR